MLCAKDNKAFGRKRAKGFEKTFYHELDELHECESSGFLIRAIGDIRGQRFIVLGSWCFVLS